MKKQMIKATTLKNIMTTLIVIIVCFSAVGIYFAFDKIDTLAEDIKSEIEKSPILGVRTDNTQALTQLKNDITKYQPIADKLNSLSITSGNAKSQIMQDINTYASANSIAISNFSFSDQSQTSSPMSMSTPNTSLTTSQVTITIPNAIEYNNFLKFIKSIETSIPKMQIQNLNISKDQSSPSKIKVEPIKIEIYTR